MWWTSRASPDSTTSATLVRVFCRTRCWCTAEVSSRDGIGARSAVECRSDSMITRAPAAIASSASGRHRSIASASASAPPPHVVQPGDGGGGEPGQVALRVHPHQLGQVVVVQHRERQHDLPAGPRAGLQQVGLRADDGGQRGDHRLPDRVQRRVGDLREQLAEVVEDQPRPGGQHRLRGVGAHRADALGAGGGHRGDQHPQLFLGVAEDLLPGQHAAVRDGDVLAGRQVGEPHQAGVHPVAVRLLGGQRALDLGVVEDPALVGVHQEHPARLQPAALQHLLRRDRQHARPRRPARRCRRWSATSGRAAARCGPGPRPARCRR